MLEGARIKSRREHNERAWLAWQIVTLPQQKGVRFSDLTFRDARGKPPKKDRAEHEANAFMAWAASRR